MLFLGTDCRLFGANARRRRGPPSWGVVPILVSREINVAEAVVVVVVVVDEVAELSLIHI